MGRYVCALVVNDQTFEPVQRVATSGEYFLHLQQAIHYVGCVITSVRYLAIPVES